MNVNSVSSNPILNNPTFNKTQTRELPADQGQDAVIRNDQAESTAASLLEEDNVSLSSSGQTRRTEGGQPTRTNLSSGEASQMASQLRNQLNDNPSQAMLALGVPDNRMVQSLLSAA